MKILILNNLDMQWVDQYKRIMPNAVWRKKRTDEMADVMLHMWCQPETAKLVSDIPCRHIVFIRRYEWYAMHWKDVDWSKVENIIFVNDWIAHSFQRVTGVTKAKIHVIYNGVDPAKWTYKNRNHGKKIAWVGFINQKKNIPLALQIMMRLDKTYELHIAGECQDGTTLDYMNYMKPKIKGKIIWNGKIDAKDMDEWLEDKNYILSTAISEGCPNNVIEAMAKGIKPIVHNWAGADKQFGEYVFNTVDEAVQMINGNSAYNSTEYIDVITEKFGLSNYDRVKEIVCGFSDRTGRDRETTLQHSEASL